MATREQADDSLHENYLLEATGCKAIVPCFQAHPGLWIESVVAKQSRLTEHVPFSFHAFMIILKDGYYWLPLLWAQCWRSNPRLCSSSKAGHHQSRPRCHCGHSPHLCRGDTCFPELSYPLHFKKHNAKLKWSACHKYLLKFVYSIFFFLRLPQLFM